MSKLYLISHIDTHCGNEILITTHAWCGFFVAPQYLQSASARGIHARLMHYTLALHETRNVCHIKGESTRTRLMQETRGASSQVHVSAHHIHAMLT